jgi:hypothetical protein
VLSSLLSPQNIPVLSYKDCRHIMSFSAPYYPFKSSDAHSSLASHSSRNRSTSSNQFHHPSNQPKRDTKEHIICLVKDPVACSYSMIVHASGCRKQNRRYSTANASIAQARIGSEDQRRTKFLCRPQPQIVISKMCQTLGRILPDIKFYDSESFPQCCFERREGSSPAFYFPRR